MCCVLHYLLHVINTVCIRANIKFLKKVKTRKQQVIKNKNIIKHVSMKKISSFLGEDNLCYACQLFTKRKFASFTGQFVPRVISVDS